MDEGALAEFQRVLMNETEMALLGAEEIEKYLKPTEESGQQTRLLYSIHAFLVSLGNVSKLLWPLPYHDPDTKKRAPRPIPGRGEILRASVSVADNSILQSRELRDIFEHFDERLEEWLSGPNPRILVDGNTWSSSRKDLPSFVKRFRNFDEASFAVLYGEKSYPLRPIIAELQKLQREVAKQYLGYMSGSVASNRILTPSGDTR